MHKMQFVLRVAVGALCAAVTAVLWEGLWLHEYVAYEFFWRFPHVVLYGSLAVLFFIGCFVWRAVSRTKGIFMIIASLLYPLSVGIRIFIESQYGIPARDSLCVYWCPQFLLLAESLALLATSVWVLLDAKKNAVLRAIVMGVFLVVVLHELRPLRPLSTIAVVGPYGAGGISLVLFYMLFMAKRVVHFHYTASVTVITYMLIYSIAGVLGYFTLAYNHIDTNFVWFHFSLWIPASSILLIALIIDLAKVETYRRSALLGIFYAVLLYAGANWQDFFVMIVTSTLGGIGGLLLSRATPQKNVHSGI